MGHEFCFFLQYLTSVIRQSRFYPFSAAITLSNIQEKKYQSVSKFAYHGKHKEVHYLFGINDRIGV
jgi:hypothetical protein